MKKCIFLALATILMTSVCASSPKNQLYIQSWYVDEVLHTKNYFENEKETIVLSYSNDSFSKSILNKETGKLNVYVKDVNGDFELILSSFVENSDIKN